MSIIALLSRSDGSDEAIDLADRSPSDLGDDELLWIDLVGAERADLDLVQRAVDPGDEAIEALTSEIGELRVRVLAGGATEVVAAPPARGDDEGLEPVRAVLGSGWVVTQHDGPSSSLDSYRERIQDGREVGRLTSVEFVTAILDWYVDGFFHAAEEAERAVDRLDHEALVGDTDILSALVRARRSVARLRRVLVLNREVVAELARPDFVARLSDEEVRALHQVAGRLDRAGEAIGHVREMLVGTFDIHMTRTAQRTNDIMRVLTWASVILLPAVVVAGIMGMNFKVPLFDDPNLFFVVVGAMLVTAVGTLLVARWRGWL